MACNGTICESGRRVNGAKILLFRPQVRDTADKVINIKLTEYTFPGDILILATHMAGILIRVQLCLSPRKGGEKVSNGRGRR